MLDQIVQTFEDQGWSCQTVADVEVIEAGFEAHHTKVKLHVQAFAKINAVSVVSQSPIVVTGAEARARLVELIMRTNEELTLGNFELRWDRGETIFRATNVFAPAGFDPAILVMLIEATIVEMDRLTPLLSIIFKADPAELAAMDVAALMQRDDLLPNPGEGG